MPFPLPHGFVSKLNFIGDKHLVYEQNKGRWKCSQRFNTFADSEKQPNQVSTICIAATVNLHAGMYSKHRSVIDEVVVYPYRQYP